MEKYTEITTAYIIDIFIMARNYFENGIYVKSNKHPCGWDFITFEYLDDVTGMFDEFVRGYEISKGCWDNHEFEGLTYENIIKEVGMTGWCFERSGVDELK